MSCCIQEFAYAETAEENSRPLAGVIVAIGALGGLSGFLRATFFGISAESLTARLREQSFKHILRQVGTYLSVIHYVK